MERRGAKPKTIDEYIAAFPPDKRKILKDLRKAIRAAAPGAVETISYRMPAFAQNGVLVYFAAFKDHVSFFPTSSGIEAFKKELDRYEGSKGTVRFPLGEPLPLKLIARIVKFRVAENAKKAGKETAPAKTKK